MDFIPAGTVIYVNFGGAFRHYGIVTERWVNGKPTVIANSLATKGVQEIKWDDFAEGRVCRVHRFPGQNQFAVLANARGLIGQPYNILAFNCEHFVATCYGEPPQSVQVMAVSLFAIAALLTLVGASASA